MSEQPCKHGRYDGPYYCGGCWEEAHPRRAEPPEGQAAGRPRQIAVEVVKAIAVGHAHESYPCMVCVDTVQNVLAREAIPPPATTPPEHWTEEGPLLGPSDYGAVDAPATTEPEPDEPPCCPICDKPFYFGRCVGCGHEEPPATTERWRCLYCAGKGYVTRADLDSIGATPETYTDNPVDEPSAPCPHKDRMGMGEDSAGNTLWRCMKCGVPLPEEPPATTDEGAAKADVIRIYDEARKLAHGVEGWDAFYVLLADALRSAESRGRARVEAAHEQATRAIVAPLIQMREETEARVETLEKALSEALEALERLRRGRYADAVVRWRAALSPPEPAQRREP